MNHLNLFKEAVVNFQVSDSLNISALENIPGIENKILGQLLISESNELIMAQVFLQAISNNLVPIVIPKSWAKERVEQVVCQFPQAHFWQNGTLKLSSIFGDLPKKFKNTYGIFSSGVTGKPKISFLRTEAAMKNARAHAQSLNITSDTIILKVLPIDHAFGLIAYVWTPIALGCTVKFLDAFEGWKSLTSEATPNSIIHFTPAWIRYLLKTHSEYKEAPPKITIGSASLHQEEIEALEKITQAKIYITYGLTEAGPRVSTGLWNLSPQSNSGYFVGRALDSVELKILTSGNTIESSGSGQLLIKSPSLKTNIEANEVINGYYKTNDFAKIAPDGLIYLATRDRFSFKFRDLFINLNDLTLIYKNDSPLLAMVWVDKYYHYWRLIVCGKKDIEIEKSLLFNLDAKVHPAEISWVASIPKTSLDKIDFYEIINSLGIDSTKKYEFYFSQI